MSICKTFREKAEVEERQIAQALIVIPPEFRRQSAVRLGQHVEKIFHAAAGIFLDAVHVLDLNEFRQEVGDVADRLLVAEMKLPHTALRELLKERPYRMIIWDLLPCFFNHTCLPLVT